MENNEPKGWKMYRLDWYLLVLEDMELSYKYNSLCARSTLYPGKTIEEAKKIIEENWNGRKTVL